MIKEIIKQWDENKYKLEEYFKNTNQSEYSSYEYIVAKIIELVINSSDGKHKYDSSKITVIDDGDYQGTQLFIFPLDTYQPSSSEYIITDTHYGSCSGCDTLQGISGYCGDLPNDEEVAQYMTLALHLVQKMRYIE